MKSYTEASVLRAIQVAERKGFLVYSPPVAAGRRTHRIVSSDGMETEVRTLAELHALVWGVRCGEVGACRTSVTREQAMEVMAAIRTQFAPYVEAGEGPTLFAPGEWDDNWQVIWEEGPFEWALIAFTGDYVGELYELARQEGMDHETAKRVATPERVDLPEGVWVEPYVSYQLTILPKE